ncbi:MAG: bifunctional DNA primase/polymerase [Chloroflexi bacterium]|nr:bifunctional DNA primase/polymerase [Chloroflexota bacterium]
MTNSLLEAALAYAARGWQVLPIQPRDKIPITAHGKDDATTDETTIRTWWQRFPYANVGVATGAVSGIVVLDVDANRGGLDALTRLESDGKQLLITLTALTGGGGRYLLFAHPGRLVNNRTNVIQGLDVRGDGGYIVVAPSVHKSGKRYTWLNEDAPIAAIPPWLMSLICREPNASSSPNPHTSERDPRAYAEAALPDELQQLARATKGHRNDQLNKSAFVLGQLIAAGLLNRARVETELTQVALSIGLEQREILKTIRSGIEDGMREPRTAPDRPRTGTSNHTDTPAEEAENGHPSTIEEQLAVLEQMVTRVPIDTDKARLPILLRTIIEKLAVLDRTIAVAFIQHKLKPHFGLTFADVRAHTSDLAKIREELEIAERVRKAQEAAAAQAEASKPKELSDDERADAMTFLMCPQIIEKVIEDMTALGYVGEDKNKVLCYCVGSSRKQDRPLSMTIKSPSAFGKSELLKTVATLLPPEDVLEFTRLTPQALAYLPQDALRHKLLIVMERNGAEASDYNIRIIQSEEKIKIAYPVKDPETGEMHTVEREVNGPLAYAETTTNPTIHAENATRVFELYLDGTAEQTRRIHERQRQNATLAGVRANLGRDAIIRRHQNAQRLLQSILVVIPYAKLIQFPVENPRARRDLPRFMETIKIIAFLRQYQKDRKQEIDPGTGQVLEYIEADLEDYATAFRYAGPAIAQGLDELPKHSRDLLDKIIKMVNESISPDVNGDKLFTRRDIRQQCRVTDKFVKDYVVPLEDEEYLEIVIGGTGKGKKIIYKLSPNVLSQTDEQTVVKGLTTPEELTEAIRSAGSTV